MPAAHPNGKAGSAAKIAAFLCFAIAAGLMIASLVITEPAKAKQFNAAPMPQEASAR